MKRVIDICAEGSALNNVISSMLASTGEGIFQYRVYHDLVTQMFMYFVDDAQQYMSVIRNLPSYELLADIFALQGDNTTLTNVFRECAVSIYMRLYNDQNFPLLGHDHILVKLNETIVVIDSLPSEKG